MTLHKYLEEFEVRAENLKTAVENDVMEVEDSLRVLQSYFNLLKHAVANFVYEKFLDNSIPDDFVPGKAKLPER